MDVDIRRMLAAEDGVHDVAEPGDLDAFLSGGLDLVGRAEDTVTELIFLTDSEREINNQFPDDK